MAPKPKLLIFGQPQAFHPLLAGLVDLADFVKASDGHDPSDYELLVIDGKTHPAEGLAPLAEKARAALEAKRAVLLLHASAAHKSALADAGVMDIYIAEGSAALLVEPRFDDQGELSRGRGLVEQFFPQPGEVSAGSVAMTLDKDGASEVTETKAAPDPGEPRIEGYANFKARLEFVVNALATGSRLSSSAVGDDPDPMQPPPGTPSNLYYVTDLLINRSWAPNGVKDKHTETPPTGHMSESGHVQIGIYYDNVNTPPQHWIKVYHTGNLQTGGPQHNSKNHRGWSLASYEIEALEALEGKQSDGSLIALDQVSPTNVNGVTQYTSATSFSIGVQAGTDGINAPLNYQVSSSQTINVTDWTVAQIAPAHWQFYQQTPYDGRSHDVNKAVDHNKGVKSLPPISLYGTQYNAQSVWVHQPATPLLRSIRYKYTTQSHYAAYDSGFWGWHSCLWWYDYTGYFTLNFHFDRVEPNS